MKTLLLYHGTNRKIVNLKKNSYLTTDFLDACNYASLKEGDIVYVFSVNTTDVIRDIHTLKKQWYISKKQLKPLKSITI